MRRTLPCAVTMLVLSPCLTFGLAPRLGTGQHTGHRTRRVAMLDPGTLWADYNLQLAAAPLVTKSITAAVIIGAGDAAAQVIESKGRTFDGARYARWAVFGLLLQGPWNHAFYVLLDETLPPTADPFTLTTLAKVFIDQFIQAPVFTCVILLFFALVEGKGVAFASKQIRTELFGVLLKNWSVFLPATAINLAFCPPELRVLFLNCVFFGWVIYLSLFLNESGPPPESANELLPKGSPETLED